MAPSYGRAQVPRVLFVPAGTAPPWVATLAHSPAVESTPYTPGETHRRPSPLAQLAPRPARSVPAHSTATDRGYGPATSLSRVSRPLSRPGLPRALRSPTALLGAARAIGAPATGRFAVHQRGLAHGSSRPLDRLARSSAPAQPALAGQSQPLSDSPLDPASSPR